MWALCRYAPLLRIWGIAKLITRTKQLLYMLLETIPVTTTTYIFLNNVASYTNMNRRRLRREKTVLQTSTVCQRLMTDDIWQIRQMTTTAGDDYKQSNKYDNDNDNDDKTPAKGQDRFNRENSNKQRRRVGNNVSLLICMWTWTHRLELGLGFGFPCPRRCRFTIEFLIGSAGTHTHEHTRTWHRKAFKFNGGCLYALWPTERTRSRLESKLRPGTLTASAPCDGIPRKQQQQQQQTH